MGTETISEYMMSQEFIPIELNENNEWHYITRSTARSLIKKAFDLDYSDQYDKRNDAFTTNTKGLSIVTILDKTAIAMLSQHAIRTDAINEKYLFSRYSQEDKIGHADIILRKGSYWKSGSLREIEWLEAEEIKKMAVHVEDMWCKEELEKNRNP